MRINLSPTSFGEAVGYAATTVVALGALWRYLVRPTWRAWKVLRVRVHAAIDLIERELTHNGGASLKDAVHRTDRKVEDALPRIEQAVSIGEENAHAIEVMAQMFDDVVDRKQEDHARMWDQIVKLGGEDPRTRLRDDR